MKYIDELVKVSNNELEFSKELLKIKEEISKSKRVYTSINTFIKNINNYCELKFKESHSENKNCILLNTNDFCMFVLNRLFLRMKKHYEIREAALLHILSYRDKIYVKESLKKQFIDTFFLIMTSGFEENKDYYFEKMSDCDEELFRFYNIFLSDMKLDIILDLVNIEPLIFVGREGKSSAILTELNILLFELRDTVKYKNGEIDVMYVYEKLVNNIIEVTITILFKNILTELNIDNLSKKYNIEKDNLSFKIGEEIANYITGKTKTKNRLLKDVIEMSNINLSKETLVEKEIYRITTERNNKIDEDFKDIFNKK